jgi:hypothetical protein
MEGSKQTLGAVIAVTLAFAAMLIRLVIPEFIIVAGGAAIVAVAWLLFVESLVWTVGAAIATAGFCIWSSQALGHAELLTHVPRVIFIGLVAAATTEVFHRRRSRSKLNSS